MRATSTRKYMCSIAIRWILSGIAGVLQLLKASSVLITNESFAWYASVYSLVCLITFCWAYSVIWFFSTKEDPGLPLDRHKQNKELVKTLFIVTLLSLLTWLPFTVNTMRHTSKVYGVAGPVLLVVIRFLQLANSIINPIVYSFKMPLFRRTLKTMFVRQKPRVLQIRGQKKMFRSKRHRSALRL